MIRIHFVLGEPMKKSLTAICAIALLLAGCSASQPQTASTRLATPPTMEAAAPTTATAETTIARPEPKKDKRGNVIKEINEVAFTTLESGAESGLKFKVVSIKPVECDAPYAPQPTGTLMAVTVSVETSPEFQGVYTTGAPTVSFGSTLWRAYSPDGTRMNSISGSATYNCFADHGRYLPNDIGPGEKATGIVVLDVTSPTGSVVYSLDSGPGWTWDYPSKP